MSYSRRVVKRRPASLTDEEWLLLLNSRFVDRGYFRPRDGRVGGRVLFSTVLCPACRERHSPAEVEACMVLPRKSASASTNGSSTSSALDAGPLTEYSELWAFLTAATYPDGSKRRTGRISLSCDVDLLGLSLIDDETGQYSFLNGKSIAGLLTEVELRLADGTLSWRVSRFNKGRK